MAPTIKDRIAAYLQKHPEGVDDDLLARNLNLSARQQANSRCRQLEAEGLVERRKVGGKIHNFWIRGEEKKGGGVPKISAPQTEETKKPVKSKTENWFWEGNVQAQVVRHLAWQGYNIMSVADTATHQRGKDIEAERNGFPVWISVKGYPARTSKTHPSTQAGHWFKGAVFDILEYRGEDAEAELGLAMPDFPRYRNLADKIQWLQPLANYSYYWVQESGEVKKE
jgi:hypothetical protein